ncbi:MAG: hypothetical protein RRA15_11755 [bacterium]|nr:hypothetical protein [bacterium]
MGCCLFLISTVAAAELPDSIAIYTSPPGQLRFYVENAGGKRTGINPVDGTVLEDIPESSLTDESVEQGTPSFFVDLYNPSSGMYWVHLKGIKDGSFLLSIRMLGRDGGKRVKFRGFISRGREYRYAISYDPEVGGTLATLPINYVFEGFNISPDGSEIRTFEKGKDLPIVFSLARKDGKPADDVRAELLLQRIVDEKPYGEEITPTTADDTDGNRVRFDEAKKQYVYELATGDLDPGIWKLMVLFDDGSRQTTWIRIK